MNWEEAVTDVELIPLPEKAVIMVVDDEPRILKLMEDTLRREGHKIYTAAAGREALEMINESPPDILITDIYMPEMDGVQLIEQVKKILPEIPVIVMTGFPEFDSAIALLKDGACDYIVKPIGPNAIITAVNKVWDRQKLAIRNKQLFSGVLVECC